MSKLPQILKQTVLLSENEYIFISPVCDFFGLSTKNQIEQLKKDPICQSDIRKISSESVFGDKRKRLVLSRRGFIRWIQLISAALVSSNLRDLFQQYQVAVFDYLYHGNEARNVQLEDIRTYAININNAINVKNHVMEYVGEQKRHRDLCLATAPEQWLHIRETLTQTKSIPEGAEKLKAKFILPTDIDELRKLKKNLQTNIHKNKNRLHFQSPNLQEQENPIPPGYKRERLKLKIENQKKQVEEINMHIFAIEKQKEE